MILNYIWISLILLAIIIGLIQAVWMGNIEIFSDILNSTFTNAKTGFELSLGLAGILSLWMGIMKIGEKAGVVNTLGKGVAPFFTRIFPEIPKNHPVFGSMLMNIAANMLGLDNAATPMGLKAMGELQELNTDKSKASNAMIMFVVLGASGLTLIPTTIMAYRAQLGATNPADVFLPILIATYIATLAGLIAVCVSQKIKIVNPIVLGTLIGLTGLVGLLIWGASLLTAETLSIVSAAAAAIILLSIITWFVLQAMIRKINVYDAFIDGAKDGFKTAVGIIPYLIAILVAVGMFRACGAMELLENGLAWCFEICGINPDLAGAVPTALMKPLSGSGARGLMLEAMTTHGADSLVGRLCCILQGTTDTTFYVLAVYFGSVSIKNTRHAVACCLIADLAGAIAAFAIAAIFFA
ncbi:MAG: nucleoside recognition domain-containing protein [Paludibacteraceae bacterium]|nr:nucleoside recognition domain-containing protein [Paludibacteraceae bacterium]